MEIFNIENLKKSSVYITPNFPSLETKRYKFSIFTLFNYLLIYSFALMLVVALIFILTPAGKLLFFIENEKLAEQEEKIESLEQKILFLGKELESMASLNQRLKYATILAGSDSLDSTAAIYDSLRKYEEKLNKAEGNIYKVLVDFLELQIKSVEIDSNVTFRSPTSGVIIQQFNKQKGHLGIDYGVKANTPVFAAADGTVVFSDYTLENGYVIIIQHKENYKSFYKHCSQLLKNERDFVRMGELIALSGNTGINTTGPHLHFELWLNDVPINPINILMK
jgi:murein DD-endopeptidase MepM/ murein hydrolase activator NlpD